MCVPQKITKTTPEQPRESKTARRQSLNGNLQQKFWVKKTRRDESVSCTKNNNKKAEVELQAALLGGRLWRFLALCVCEWRLSHGFGTVCRDDRSRINVLVLAGCRLALVCAWASDL